MNFKNIIRNILGAASLMIITAAPTAWGADPSLNSVEVISDFTNLATGFSADRTEYTIDNCQSKKVIVAATPKSATAMVDIVSNGTTYSNHSLVDVPAKNGKIEVKVTDGSDTRTYVFNFTTPKFTIYYDNSATNWSSVRIHYWNTPKTTWPGVEMTNVKDNVWSYTFPDDEDPSTLTGFLFDNGSGSGDANQTGNYQQVPVNGHIYKGAGGNKGAVSDQGEYYTGPVKPKITVSPAQGKVKGTTVITVTIDNDATSISGSFNGSDLSLSNGSNSLTVSDYLNDGATGTLTVTATNDLGSDQVTTSFTRDDTTPVITLTGDQRELSIYQIMVGSFQHGEGGASGYSDMWGPKGHRKNGNLRGIINALDYIKDLGMNAIWMTPVFDSTNGQGGEQLQATGYFCTNYFKIDPKFGTLDEFKELVEKAHERGIYIILDGVFGHHGGVSQASPNGNRIDSTKSSNVRGGNDAGNVSYPNSLAYFKEVVRYWMELGVDGWRLDQCYQVYQGGHNYWYDLRMEVEAVASERRNRGEQWGTLGYMVGEDWTGAGSITVTQQNGLKSVMDFDGKNNLVNLGSGVGSIGWFLSNDAKARGYKDDGVEPTIFLSNHDTSRVGDTVTDADKLITRHAAVACYTGPTCTYYGDEIGDQSGDGNDDNKGRTSGRITGFNSTEQKIHDGVAKWFKARSENPAMWRGTVDRKQVSNNTEVITKTDAQTGNKIVAIFSSVNTSVSIGGSGEDLINGGTVSGSVNVSSWVPALIRMN
ncbi:MAG: alpha-amylase family glycosyl hydrolase [Muribaculaceae bacterium]|nr:alpha-amylase family glycosyl hydrolase [Muribaculaceae bacterium]